MPDANAKSFVVDASFVISFLLPDEYNLKVTDYFHQFQEGTLQFISSPLLSFEVANGLILALRRKRINRSYCLKRLEEFLEYNIKIRKVDCVDACSLAQKYNLTFYDASYLYLAQSQNLPLLTLDKHLIPFDNSQY